MQKVSKRQQRTLMSTLDGMSFSCGSPLEDLNVADELKDMVFVRSLNCCEPIEHLYYTAKYEPICVYCGQVEPFKDDKSYPQCEDCKDKPTISKTIFFPLCLLFTFLWPCGCPLCGYGLCSHVQILTMQFPVLNSGSPHVRISCPPACHRQKWKDQ